METISKRLKDTLRETTQYDRKYTNEGFRQLIFEHTGMKYGEDYQESHFAGCLSALRKSGDIVQVQRGEYRKGDPEPRHAGPAAMNTPDFTDSVNDRDVSMAQVKEGIIQSVQRELAYLKSVTPKMVLSFDSSEEDIQFMLKVKELVRTLEEFRRQVNL